MRFLSIFLMLLTCILSSLSPSHNAQAGTAYDFTFRGIDGSDINLNDFRGKVLLVVNTASRCGYTHQYAGLQTLFDTYKDDGFVVLGVPSHDFSQEPLSNAAVKEFCEVQFGINFPMAAKTSVKTEQKHPFYSWTQQQLGRQGIPSWNFHKILINRQGQAIKGYSPAVTPLARLLVDDIKQALE